MRAAKSSGCLRRQTVTTPENYNGILPLYKPVRITSHDAVQRVRRITRQKEVGHTGTLDPLAEGLLLLCLGRATKIARFLTDMEKTYLAEVRLGLRSETFDAEGINNDQAPAPVPELTSEQLRDVLSNYLGRTRQRVPAYSAARVGGERLYRKARRGESADLPVREINISGIELNGHDSDTLQIEVTCSKGTYIRSLASDIGERIGCGGYLKSLVRTRVGSIDVEHALNLEQVETLDRDGILESMLLPIERFLPYGAVFVTDRFSRLVAQGRTLNPGDVTKIEGEFDAGDRIVLKNNLGRALAVGTAGADSKRFRASTDNRLFTYMRVLN